MRVRKLGDVSVPTTFLSGWLAQQKNVEKRLVQYKDDIRDVSSQPIKQFLHDGLTKKPNPHPRHRYEYPLKTFHEGRSVVGQDFVEASDLEWNRQMQLQCNKDALPPLPSKQCFPGPKCNKCEVKVVMDHIHKIFTQPVDPDVLETFRNESKPDHDASYTEDRCSPFLLPINDHLVVPTTTPMSSFRSTYSHDIRNEFTKKYCTTPRFVVNITGGEDVKHDSKVTGRNRQVHTDMKKKLRHSRRYTQVLHSYPETEKLDQLDGHSLKLVPRSDVTSGSSDAMGYPHRLRLPHIS